LAHAGLFAHCQLSGTHLQMPLIRRRFDRSYFESILHPSHFLSRRNLKRFKLIQNQKTHGKLLEIGSGGGAFLKLAASRFEVWSIDISPYAVSKLPASLRERITIGDIENLPLPVQAFDVITAFNVLEHLRHPQGVLKKVYRALRPGGIFVGSVPCNASLIGTVHTAITNFFDRTHISCYKVETWRTAFREAGMRDVRLFGELMLDGRFCKYIRHPLWSHFSFNMMFVSRP